MKHEGPSTAQCRATLGLPTEEVYPITRPSTQERGLACSRCGQTIFVPSGDHEGALVELLCSRCGMNDIYHRKALRDLPVPPPEKGQR